MKRILKNIAKIIGLLIAIPIIYIVVSLLLTIIPISEKESNQPKVHTVYVATNGVHADLVLPKNLIDQAILKDQIIRTNDTYFAFGWGEENFYINTPTWGDLNSDWIPIKITDDQLSKLNTYVAQTFDETSGKKVIVDGATYTTNQDNFYRAKGNYMFYRTCNSWLNRGLKESGMKGSLWTPFDFGVTRWYEEEE